MADLSGGAPRRILQAILDKKTWPAILLIAALGVTLFLIPKLAPTASAPKKSPAPAAETAKETDDYEKRVEKRLEEILSLAEGAGKVRVMVTLEGGERSFVERDETVSSQRQDETDSAGGRRLAENNSAESRAIMVAQSDGSQNPLITYEETPKITGVIIIAEGGGEVGVKDALIRAAQTVLGIGIDKVTVLKMRA
ncbi:MAG: hypothetical protein LBK41_01500 [Clostridiales bacterium]|jgi:stage III sporulation protein AG|nr:hypothetical protein [Clostridiales bacterium]